MSWIRFSRCTIRCQTRVAVPTTQGCPSLIPSAGQRTVSAAKHTNTIHHARRNMRLIRDFHRWMLGGQTIVELEYNLEVLEQRRKFKEGATMEPNTQSSTHHLLPCEPHIVKWLLRHMWRLSVCKGFESIRVGDKSIQDTALQDEHDHNWTVTFERTFVLISTCTPSRFPAPQTLEVTTASWASLFAETTYIFCLPSFDAEPTTYPLSLQYHGSATSNVSSN